MPKNSVILISKRFPKGRPWTPARQENIKGTCLFVHTSYEHESQEPDNPKDIKKPEWIVSERQYGIRVIPLSFATKKFAIEVAHEFWSQLPQSLIDWLSSTDKDHATKVNVDKNYKKLYPDDFEYMTKLYKNLRFKYAYHPGTTK